MSKKLLFYFIILIFILAEITPIFPAFAARTNCCKLRHEIILDDIEICGPPIGQPLGCNPDTANCCIEQATWTFNEGEVIGPAEEGTTQCWSGKVQLNIDIPTPRRWTVCLIDTIYSVTDVLFWFAISLSIILGIITGFFFFTAGGEPYKIEKAKSMLIWLVVGIAVAVSAKVLTALIIAIMI